MSKKLFFLSLVVLAVGLAVPKGALGVTLDIRITNGADDVEERIGPNNGAMDITSSDLEFPYEDPGKVDPQVLGLRFANLPLPRGAMITNAYIEFEVDETKSGTLPVNVIIDGELSPNAAPFTSARNNVTQRSPTTAVVPWSVPNWTQNDVKWQTPNIASVVQEVVNQQGWAFGNALVVIFTDDPANPSTGVRCAEAVEGEATAAPLLHIEATVKGAFSPTPANGATEVDTAMLEWLGEGASVTYKVYLSTDPNVDDADFIGETPVNLQVVTLTPGTTYYWRVDQIEAGGPVNVGEVWSFTTLALEAHLPSPADAATGVAVDAKLSWVSGKGAILHDLYFGTDQAAVAAADPSTFKGKLMTPSFDPGLLASFTTYYWKVNEFAGPVTNAGPVWSFSTVDYYVIVNDQMTLNYNNTAAPFYSELVVDTPADLTFDGVANLTLRFKGASTNSVEPLYVALEDSTGASAIVTHPDAAATQIGQWWKWKIPLAAFSGAGVNLTAAAKLHIGVGNRLSPTAGASGTILIDDVLVVKPVVIQEPADVTAPGDNVKGVPNDGVNAGGNTAGWPAAEAPPNAIDNNVNTKLLHFKGEVQPTGIQVSPSAGASIVTGLTFTTANDAEERDPVAYELYGSNVSIDGPYELIAAGQIVDFNQPVAWPRYTKNTTPISFTNTVAYEHYQVLFPRVRTPASANSMQIAEVELIGTVGAVAKPKVIWVSDNKTPTTAGVPADQAWVDLLSAQGYDVDLSFRNKEARTLDDAKIAALNAADLIIISRDTNSGDYASNAAEVTQWNSITAPVLMQVAQISQSSRWRWINIGATNSAKPILQAVATTHPIFNGVTLDASNQVDVLTTNVSFVSTADVGNGTLVASRADNGQVWIVEWQAGLAFYASSTETPAGHRMLFCSGGTTGVSDGTYDLTAEGEKMFLNAVAYMAK